MAQPENLSFIIRHTIKPGREAEYESWLQRIVAKAGSYQGHQGANIIKPTKGHSEYVTVIHFSNIDAAKIWMESADRKNLIQQISEALVFGDTTEIRTGIDFWFTPEGDAKPLPWKQWLITTGVIAPLTMIVPYVLSPLFETFPWLQVFGVRHIVVAAAIVAIVTFVVMPRLARLLHGWLYKK